MTYVNAEYFWSRKRTVDIMKLIGWCLQELLCSLERRSFAGRLQDSGMVIPVYDIITMARQIVGYDVRLLLFITVAS